jgi:hypothetical protein
MWMMPLSARATDDTLTAATAINAAKAARNPIGRILFL